ncbi:putative 3-hydroxyacyl-CoA dehydrogenase [Aspergillus bertholletiae]|uniref:Putative 3-hydroxyacyl-CoA dehydrogenase n=1 Tax=Aspergillus bertholletiae TaxID=1226010 RepID=A0A5N7BJ27_9EURO|nr:putative 3-hydroxyacyl-CoA dehydrogenase [Aspergillus bertholletiae]
MARFDPNHKTLHLSALEDAVVVLSGGSTGIGASTVRELFFRGANVIFGDVNDAAAEEVIISTSPEKVHYVKTDVRCYEDVRKLFQFALSRYGRVDHAIANAGVLERPGWFDPQNSLDDLAKEPSTFTLDVNLTGVVFFTHLALAYLSQNNDDGAVDKSLTLLSSHGGFKETPGMFLYSTAKHAVIGLMRSLRPYVANTFPGVRVNAVCPSMTRTNMVDGVVGDWQKGDLPVNGPEDIASVLVAIAAAGPDWDNKLQRGLHGRAIYVLGGQSYDIEEGLDKTEPIWLGKDASAKVKLAQQSLGVGDKWITGKR